MMAKISKFDRAALALVRDRVGAALAPVLADLGLSVAFRGGSFNGDVYCPKIEFAVAGGAERVARAGMDAASLLYGLSGDDYGKTFFYRGSSYRIDGINARASKFPINVTNLSSGKRMKMQADAVLRVLGRDKAAA